MYSLANRYPTDKEWADKWEKRIKEFDPKYRRKSNDIVCSLHFAKTSMQPVTRQLCDHAVPIYFPQKIAEPVPEATSSKCLIVGCPTKFDGTNPNIKGFR